MVAVPLGLARALRRLSLMSTQEERPRKVPGKERPAPPTKADRLEAERPREQEEGIASGRRGGDAAPSDKPEGTPPHPQDVNEIGERA